MTTETSEHWALSLIRTAEREGFFGDIALQFKAGRLVLIRRAETILPPTEEPMRSSK